jgi:hypothetical protein
MLLVAVLASVFAQFSLDFYVRLRSKCGAFALSQRCQRFWFVALTATTVSARAVRNISVRVYFYFIFGLLVQVSYSASHFGSFSL